MIHLSIGWFVDGSYLIKAWNDACQSAGRTERIDFVKLRQLIEQELNDSIDEAYYFDADPDPNMAKVSSFHNFLAYPPPSGPGLRVKLYWMQKRQLYWPSSLGGGPVMHPTLNIQYELTQQKAVDVGLAFHLVRSHANRGWTKLALCAGDADFHEVAQYFVETKNVDLYLIGAMKSISEELRPYARRIFDVSTLIDRIRLTQ